MSVTKELTSIKKKKKNSTMEVNGVHQLSSYQHSSKYLLLCSAEDRNSYRFGTTWGWI